MWAKVLPFRCSGQQLALCPRCHVANARANMTVSGFDGVDTMTLINASIIHEVSFADIGQAILTFNNLTTKNVADLPQESATTKFAAKIARFRSTRH